MIHHDPHEIAQAFRFDPYRTHVWQAGGETIIDYFDGDQHLASIGIRLLEDGGVEATRFWVQEGYQGQGIFTNAHKWAKTQPSSKIAADTGEAEFYRRSGYVERDGVLVLDKKKTGKWLKGR